MTLHEAIEQVLQSNGKPMSTSEIAEIINYEKQYVRRDNEAIQATQIAARVGNYPNLFARDNGKIKLVKDDIASLLFQKTRNEIVHNINENKYYEKTGQFSLLKNSIEKILEKDSNVADNNLAEEPSEEYGSNNQTTQNKFDAAYKLCHWYLLQGSKHQLLLKEEFASLLGGLDWFSNANNTLLLDTSIFNFFILKIIQQNIGASFNILNDQETMMWNEEISDFNKFISDCINDHFHRRNFKGERRLATGIFIAPMGIRSGRPIEYESIINEINSRKNKLDKAILVVSVGSLTSSRTSMIDARNAIIESGYLDAVVELPSGIFENTAVKTALMLFDFNRDKNDKIYLLNASSSESDNLSEISKVINTRGFLNDLSLEVSKEEISKEDYNLNPSKYVYDITNFDLKEGHEIFTLAQIITDKKTGTILNSHNKVFYSGGEYKLVRNSDLSKNSIFFTPLQSSVGIDYDQLIAEKLSLISGGLVVSSTNQNVKVNVLPEKESFVIGNFIHWLKPNPSIVNDEYLAKELLKPYVLKQLDYYTSGSSHMHLLRMKDLLKIQVQLPSLNIQRREILSELRNVELKEYNSNEISDKELDFIKTLKHSLKQPTAGLGNDFASLKNYLKFKISNKQTLSGEEPIVPIFEDDELETIERYTLENTLARMERSLFEIDYILEQAIKLIAIASPVKKDIDLKDLLLQVKAEYPNLTIKVSGPQKTIVADGNQLKVALRNLIENASKHGGFKDLKVTPTIWLEIRKTPKDYVELSVRNNGKPLPSEFIIDDFLAKGKSSEAQVGSGFGGFLVGQIITNHKGKIILNKNIGNEMLPHNVEFVITLPR